MESSTSTGGGTALREMRADVARVVGWLGWMDVLVDARGVRMCRFLTDMMKQIWPSAYHIQTAILPGPKCVMVSETA